MPPGPRLRALLLATVCQAAGGAGTEVFGQGSGTTSILVLELPATARALALGGAYTAVVGDVGSVFMNPAGLAPIKRFAFGASYQRYLLGSNLASGAAAVRVGRFHVGAGLSVLDYGSDSVFVEDPLPGTATGELVSAYSAAAIGAIAYRRGLLSIGGNVKVVRDRIAAGASAPYEVSGAAVDVGLAAALFDIAALGVLVQNAGGSLRSRAGVAGPLPRTTRLGFTLNFIDPQGATRLMATTDWVAPPGGDSYWAFGFEGGVVSGGVGVVGRLGFVSGRAESDGSGPVFGGGLVVRGFRVDYGYQGFDVLGGPTHRVSIGWLP